MKPFLLLISFFVISANCTAQKNETSVIIVPCKAGTLIIDGSPITTVEADDATKQVLNYGEHYLQLKTNSEKFNLTVNIDENTKGIIKLGCVENVKGAVRMLDKKLELGGLLIDEKENNVFGLDKGDEVIINCSVLNKKGNATLIIKDYNNGNEIYKKQSFHDIMNEKLIIPSKGIYLFILYTDALFGKDATLTIDRVASSSGNPFFNTTVKTVYDTTSVTVLETTTRVYSAGNLDHSNRTVLAIYLPANVSYWGYLINVGQESKEKTKEFVSSLSNVGTIAYTNPLLLLGFKIIPSLPVFNSSETINYQFVDNQNAQLFQYGRPYSYFAFKHGDNITRDYSIVPGYIPNLNLAMTNESSFTGRDVSVSVEAFIVKSKLALQE